MSIVISEMLKKLRKEKGFSQENLAAYAGVTVQAVSKWENGISCPDISLLPVLAQIFDVSIDYLLMGTDTDIINLPDDNVLRIVQARGNKILACGQSDLSLIMKLQMPDKSSQPELKIEIRGSCSVEGDVNGDIKCGGGVNCGNVRGGIHAGHGVNCGNVGGGVHTGEMVNCGNIEGAVFAGDEVNCGNIRGEVSSNGNITCGDIYGNVHKCNGDITCTGISGEVHCKGNIKYVVKQ